jgi:hypothetical protein
MTGSLPLVTEDNAADVGTRLREKDLLAPVPIMALQQGRTVEELGIAPPGAFSREEKSLSIDIEVVDVDSPIAHPYTDQTRLRQESSDGIAFVEPSSQDMPIEDVAFEEEVDLDAHPETPLPTPAPADSVPPPRPLASVPPPLPPRRAPSAPPPTMRPTAVNGLDAARGLFLRAATGAVMSPAESVWLVRCLAAVLLDGIDDGRLAAIVARLGPPPRD